MKLYIFKTSRISDCMISYYYNIYNFYEHESKYTQDTTKLSPIELFIICHN